MTFRLLFALLVCGTWPCAADPVQIRCFPSDAEIYVLEGSQEVPRGPVSLPVSLDANLSSVRLVLRRTGYRSLELEVPTAIPVFPPESAPALELKRDYAHPMYWGGPFALGLCLLWFVRRGPGSAESRRKRLTRDVVAKAKHTGQFVGGYLLLEAIGEGGMARVYRAVPQASPELSKAVALKLLRREFCEDAEYCKRFGREAKIASTIKDPHVVRTFSHGTHEGQLFIAMELLQGKTLRDLLDEHGRMRLPEAAHLATQALAGLSAAHREGISHRDVKPENLFVEGNNVLKVTDFGVARGDGYTCATSTGLVMGTPCYMAPEQVGGEINPASDQYAMGCVLYEMLVGQPPFDDDDPLALCLKHGCERFPSIAESRPDLPEGFIAVLEKMVSKKPADRFASAQEAAHALAPFLGERP